MSEQIDIKTGIEHKRLENLTNIVEEIIDGIKGNRDMHGSEMPDLESEESVAQRRNHPGQGLKILIPKQMLCRLSISLTHLKAGKNSEQLN